MSLEKEAAELITIMASDGRLLQAADAEGMAYTNVGKRGK